MDQKRYVMSLLLCNQQETKINDACYTETKMDQKSVMPLLHSNQKGPQISDASVAQQPTKAKNR